MIRILTIAAVALNVAPALADDFMTIHLDNQKIGAPVAAYWQAETLAAQQDGFLGIHRDNQKTGSLVVSFWDAYASVGERNVMMGLDMDNQTFNSAVLDFWKGNLNPAAVYGDVAGRR